MSKDRFQEEVEAAVEYYLTDCLTIEIDKKMTFCGDDRIKVRLLLDGTEISQDNVIVGDMS